jgi:hypothetical protein
MFGSRTATERFLEVIGNVCAYENPFAICHLFALSGYREKNNPANTEQVYKPNSVLRSETEAAIIHLVQPLPAGSSDLPGGRSLLSSQKDFGRAALLTPPYLVLHREEFAWPRMSPHAPVRSYRTISPITL